MFNISCFPRRDTGHDARSQGLACSSGLFPSRPAKACVLEFFFNFAEGSMKQKAPKPRPRYFGLKFCVAVFRHGCRLQEFLKPIRYIEVTSGSGSESA